MHLLFPSLYHLKIMLTIFFKIMSVYVDIFVAKETVKHSVLRKQHLNSKETFSWGYISFKKLIF